MRDIPTGPEYVRTLKILHIALAVGMLMISGMLYFVSQQSDWQFDMAEHSDLFQWIGLSAVIVGPIIGRSLFSRGVSSISKEKEIQEKLNDYRMACIKRAALFEGPGVLCVIGYFLSGNILLLGFALVMALLIAMHIPSKTRIIQDLELSHSQVNESGI